MEKSNAELNASPEVPEEENSLNPEEMEAPGCESENADQGESDEELLGNLSNETENGEATENSGEESEKSNLGAENSDSESENGSETTTAPVTEDESDAESQEDVGGTHEKFGQSDNESDENLEQGDVVTMFENPTFHVSSPENDQLELSLPSTSRRTTQKFALSLPQSHSLTAAPRPRSNVHSVASFSLMQHYKPPSVLASRKRQIDQSSMENEQTANKRQKIGSRVKAVAKKVLAKSKTSKMDPPAQPRTRMSLRSATKSDSTPKSTKKAAGGNKKEQTSEASLLGKTYRMSQDGSDEEPVGDKPAKIAKKSKKVSSFYFILGRIFSKVNQSSQ